VAEADHFYANIRRGVLLLESGRAREALPFLQAAIAANPDSPHGYAELARCYNEIPSERYKSIAAIDRAIALEPYSSFFLGRKAWFLVCLMRFRAALAAAQQGLAINPNCAQSLNGLANAYTKLGQWRKAEEVCRRILAHDPNDVPGLNLLAQALRHQGRYKETREVVAQLLANVPNDSFGQANAGYAALAAGDHLRANEHFLASLRMDPHFDLARRGLLQSLRARIWIIRLNMRIGSFVRYQPSGRELLYLVAGVVLAVLAVIGLYKMLNWIHPVTGALFGGFLIFLFSFGVLGLAFWMWFSIVVGIFGNFLLLFDPLGRHALNRTEKARAIMAILWFGACVSLALFTGGGVIVVVLVALLLLVAVTVQIPLLYDRWLRRRLEKTDG
jgi:Tfp pilus assembly protein PilF